MASALRQAEQSRQNALDASPRVLVVDDDAGVRYTLRGALEDAGGAVDEAVDEAADRATALVRLEPFRPDLRVTDLRMPGMDGRLATLVQRVGPRDVTVLVTGEDHTRKVDVRIVAATHRDLRQRVQEGRFREWPGNVRELENAIEMLVALSHMGELDTTLLPGTADARPIGLGLKERMDAYERGLVVEALRQAKNSRAEAARILGISRVTLYDKLKKHLLAAPGDAD